MTVDALDQIDRWPVEHAAAAVIDADGTTVAAHGEADFRFRLASLSKPMAAWAILIGVEEGCVSLDEPVADAAPGITLRHLLAHVGGYPFEGTKPVSGVERRRIYSNTGIEIAAKALASATAMPFEEYLRLAVFEPLGMVSTELLGSPAHGVYSNAVDVARFVGELLAPRLIAAPTHADATSVQYPDLSGIVPGVGRFDPCPWGLGLEIHGVKSPHWMGSDNSARTVGHFGGTGTMMWADLDAAVGLVALTDREFDQWAIEAMQVWPALSNAVLKQARPR